jgi:beta-phosphoglucomutase
MLCTQLQATIYQPTSPIRKIMNAANEHIKNIKTTVTEDTVFFFDMDGTLVDTNYANFLSYKKAIKSVTKSTKKLNYNSDKRFCRSNLKTAVPNLTEIEYDKIIQEKEKYYTDFLHETKLNEETTNILFKYSETNKTVLVSNCRKDRAMATLKHFGLVEKFSYIFCRENVDNYKKINKFQNALSKLAIQSNFIIAFENEESEIADAQKAGISIINPKNI